MRLNGLPAQLESFLARKDWHAKGLLTDTLEWKRKSGNNYGKKYLSETVGRKLRLLEEMRIIAVKDDGVSVQYKWIPIEWRGTYIPWSERPLSAKSVLFKKT